MRVTFDEFELDQDRFELRHNGELVPVEPQVFDVLAFLIERRDRVVSKEELLDGVWGDRFVSESALTSRIKAVRQALGDDGSTQRLVQTVRGRGYRFLASVTETVPGASPTTHGAKEPARTGIPSGVVTFLVVDVEDGAEFWAADREAMAASMLLYDRVLTEQAAAHNGFVFDSTGDARSIAFSLASDAVDAAVALQHAHLVLAWPGSALPVQMAMHMGEAVERSGGYFGPVVELAARLGSAGHAGQVLLTDQVRQAATVEATDLGVHDLHDATEPTHVFQLGTSFHPALRVAAPRPTNLPSAPSRLIGREETLASVHHALTEHRLVTLTAAGGTGKTRLALAVGEAKLSQQRAGVWFVDLTTVSDDDLVPEKIAAVSELPRSTALDLMDSLIAKSLVVSERNGDQVRFRLLETTSAYAERALRDGTGLRDVSDRHLEHYRRVCAPYDVGLWASFLPSRLSSDRDNIRAAIAWATESGRWSEARTLVFSASTVLQTQPEDLMAMANACLANLDEDDAVTTACLHWVKIYTGIQYDFAEPQTIAASLADSPDETLRTFSAVWQSFFQFHTEDAETSLASCNRLIAKIETDSIMKHQLLAVVELIAGWSTANLGEHERALEHHARAQARLLEHAPSTTLLAETLASEGIAHVVLGNPAAALTIADRLDEHNYLYFGGDEVRSAALLALGNLDPARKIVHTHAADGATGRFSRKANNSLLLLALLAEAEHDVERAGQLLLTVENPRNPLVSLSYELARRLEMSESFGAANRRGAADPHASGRRAIEVLHTEIARRGW